MTNITNENQAQVFIQNLNAYDKGQFIGEWLKLPCTRKDFDKVLKKIKLPRNSDRYFFSEMTNFNTPTFLTFQELKKHTKIYMEIDKIIPSYHDSGLSDTDYYRLKCSVFEEVEKMIESGMKIDKIVEVVSNYKVFTKGYKSENVLTKFGYYLLTTYNFLDYNNLYGTTQNYINVEQFGYDSLICGYYNLLEINKDKENTKEYNYIIVDFNDY